MEISIDKIILREKQYVEKFQNDERFRKVFGGEEDRLISELCKEMVDYHNTIANILQKYQQLQADYENRLKADEIDMLEELQKEIKETVNEEKLIDEKWANGLSYSTKIIQQKIDKLKETKDGNN